jgi:hypothetical protein
MQAVGKTSFAAAGGGALAFAPSAGAERREELLRQLDHVEAAVNRILVPASFGDLFYGLRGHIEFVRRKLASDGTDLPPS